MSFWWKAPWKLSTLNVLCQQTLGFLVFMVASAFSKRMFWLFCESKLLSQFLVTEKFPLSLFYWPQKFWSIGVVSFCFRMLFVVTVNQVSVALQKQQGYSESCFTNFQNFCMEFYDCTKLPYSESFIAPVVYSVCSSPKLSGGLSLPWYLRLF